MVSLGPGVLSGGGGGGRPAGRCGRGRRRRGATARRRARAGAHHRLLHADRRRSWRLGADRRRERAVRRVRDGRQATAGAEPDRVAGLHAAAVHARRRAARRRRGAAAAGCLVVGGHTIDDPEPKYGMAVVGLASPGRLFTIDAARPGDTLVLTKAIGTGVVATAHKRGGAPPTCWRRRHVDDHAERRRERGGAGLRGDRGDRRDRFLTPRPPAPDAPGQRRVRGLRGVAVPLLPGALELTSAGYVSGGTRNNMAYLEPWASFIRRAGRRGRAAAGRADVRRSAAGTAAPGRLVAELSRRGTPAAVIGRVEPGQAGQIDVRANARTVRRDAIGVATATQPDAGGPGGAPPGRGIEWRVTNVCRSPHRGSSQAGRVVDARLGRRFPGSPRYSCLLRPSAGWNVRGRDYGETMTFVDEGRSMSRRPPTYSRHLPEERPAAADRHRDRMAGTRRARSRLGVAAERITAAMSGFAARARASDQLLSGGAAVRCPADHRARRAA